MPKTVSITLYTAEELRAVNPKAFERAHAKYLETAFQYDWWDNIQEDAAQVGLIIDGFDVERRTIDIKFEGSIGETCQEIFAQHGRDCETFKTAQLFYARRHDGSTKKNDYRESAARKFGRDYLKRLQQEAECMETVEYFLEEPEANERFYTATGDIYRE